MKRGIFLFALGALALSGCYQAAEGETAGQEVAAPAYALTGSVVDQADLFTEQQEHALAVKLAGLEQQTGHQMVVTTTTSLDGRDIADYTRDLGNAWGVGRAGHDDGVILLVAPKERKVRIEVGRGLVSELSDEQCAQIIEGQILPRFRAGDMAGGVAQGTDAIIAALS